MLCLCLRLLVSWRFHALAFWPHLTLQKLLVIASAAEVFHNTLQAQIAYTTHCASAHCWQGYLWTSNPSVFPCARALMLMKQEGGKIKCLSSSLLSELFTPLFSTSSQNEHTNSCSLPSIILPRHRVHADGSSDSAFCMWKLHADCSEGLYKTNRIPSVHYTLPWKLQQQQARLYAWSSLSFW